GVGVGTIIDDEPVPTVSINDVTVTEGNTGTTNATFTISMTNPTALSYQYSWTTVNTTTMATGVARAGADFQAKEGSVIFAPGETVKQVTVPVIGDTFTEGDETFSVTVTRVQGGPLVADGIGVGTIVDDDPTSGTMTFTATAWGSARSLPGGTFNRVTTDGTSVALSRTASGEEDRGLFEFDVSRVIEGDVTYALFTFTTTATTAAPSGTFAVLGYSGNGTIELADATAAGSLLASYTESASTPVRQTLVLDRDAILALTGGSNWLGLRLQATSTTAFAPVASPTSGPANAPTVTFSTDPAVVPGVAVNDVSVSETGVNGGASQLNFTISLSQ